MKTEQQIKKLFHEWIAEKHNILCVRTAYEDDWSSLRRRMYVLDKRIKLFKWVLDDKEIFHDTEF